MRRRKRLTRAERARRKRERATAEAEPAALAVEVETEAVPEQAEGVRGLLCDPGHVRSDLQMLTKYMGAGAFTPDEVTAMVTKVGSIVKKGDNRESVAAFKALLSQAKLSFEIEKQNEPKRHEHKHAYLHEHIGTKRNRVEEAAARLGITLPPRLPADTAVAVDGVENEAPDETILESEVDRSS